MPEGPSMPVTGVQVVRLARRQPAAPGSAVSRPVAASREKAMIASAVPAPT